MFYVFLGQHSVEDDVMATTMCLVEQTLNAGQTKPVTSDVSNLEAQSSIQFLLGHKILCLPYLPGVEDFVDHRKQFNHRIIIGTIWKKVRTNFEQSSKLAKGNKQNPYKR